MRIEKYALQHKAQKKWYSYEYHFFYRLIMSPILMKFYTINDSFVSSIKLIEPKIQDNYGGKRPYIGVLRYSPMSRPNNHKIKIELG